MRWWRSNAPWTKTSKSPLLDTDDGSDDPVPLGLVLDLDEAFRVLSALEDALTELENVGAAPGLQDELATVIRLVHGRLGMEEGGAQ